MLIALPHSTDAPMNDACDKAESNTHESKARPSPHLQSIRPPSIAAPALGKLLDGLGYLNNNADNLLGYLKTVCTHPIFLFRCGMFRAASDLLELVDRGIPRRRLR